jgi:predicted enzyme related to lactoylglutathione lyase
MALTARMVTMDCADPTRLAAFWSQAAGYRVLADYDGFYVMLAPPGGEGLRLGLQKVPEERVTKNRAHVDWQAEDRETEVKRLVELGATVLDEQTVGGFAWTVLADPEGNEFCVSGRE